MCTYTQTQITDWYTTQTLTHTHTYKDGTDIHALDAQSFEFDTQTTHNCTQMTTTTR